MRTALIGHRGVGKSAILRRIQKAYEEVGLSLQCYDLDSEIEKAAGKSIATIFHDDGETVFRDWENKVFARLDAETVKSQCDVFVALGAGFNSENIPSDWRALWIRRRSDETGRLFLDRPRLDLSVSAIEEFRGRYQARTPSFRARADETLWLDEGLIGDDDAENDFFLGRYSNLQADLTLQPWHLRTFEVASRFLSARCKWGVRFFEIRDDLLSQEQIELALRLLPDERILLSFRDPLREKESRDLIEAHGFVFDWPIERGECRWGEPRFYSLHERRAGQSLSEALSRLAAHLASHLPPDCQLKAALPVSSFRELAEGEAWRRADPLRRIFLPLSDDGRWSWYRLWQGSRSSLNFFREDEGSGADQPTLLQWARRQRMNSVWFAAVLGDPVVHSRTPIEQRDFFAERNAPVYAIRVREEEWREGALEFLQELGLRWAAVTAPLKERAFEACALRDQKADGVQAVNTLLWNEDEKKWRGTNTDLEGFSRLIKDAELSQPVAVWGGGGTLRVIRKVLPDARYYSMRTGEDRESLATPARDLLPGAVIWAAGSAVQTPPDSWRPRVVVDLSYTEDSPAREFALRVGAKYISGLTMFLAQAESQRKFWSDFEKGPQ